MASAPSPQTAAVLRHINFATFFPSFIFLLVQGIISHKPYPALCLIPHFFSAGLSALCLYRDAIAAKGSPIHALSAANLVICDLCLAIWLFAFLVPSWVTLDHTWQPGIVMLGTYGTVFIMTNFSIHSFFVLTQIWHSLTTLHCKCAYCRSWAADEPPPGCRGGSSRRAGGTFEEYTPLRDGDEGPQEDGEMVAAEEGLIGARAHD